jgi:hypothetical protein
MLIGEAMALGQLGLGIGQMFGAGSAGSQQAYQSAYQNFIPKLHAESYDSYEE